MLLNVCNGEIEDASLPNRSQHVPSARAVASVRGGVFANQTGQDLQLAEGDADFAIQDEEQAAGAGVAEFGAGDCGVGLDGGREGDAEVGTFLHGGEDGVADFLFQHGAERVGAEQVA
jgi:hypothetical protein